MALDATADLLAGVVVVAQPTPAGGSPHTTNCVLLVGRDGDVQIVDPGWDTPANRERIIHAVDGMGSPSAVVATHLHPDHLGLAGWLRTELQVPVRLHRAEQLAAERLTEAAETAVEDARERIRRWGVPDDDAGDLLDVARRAESAGPSSDGVTAGVGRDGFVADELLDEGDDLGISGRVVRVLHTPGHTPGHMVLVDDSAGAVLTGDLVLPEIFPGIGLGGPADDPIADYLDSLARVAELEPTGPERVVIPGHGPVFTGLRRRCEETAAHHLRRSAEIAALAADRPRATVWQIAERVAWTAGWQNLRGFYRVSALAQTEQHLDYLERH